MKDEYVLYLDESEFKCSKVFAIAGIAIKKEDVELLEQSIMNMMNILVLRNHDSGVVETTIPDTETTFDWLDCF